MESIDSGAPEPGQLFVIAAPSGAGKTTLVHRLMEAGDDLRFSVSFTTRPQRTNEVNGRDYHFVEPDTFRTMIEANDFLEHAEVFDHHYGTSKTQVEGLLNAGHNVILEIDWQGARQVRDHMPDCRSVFILPPSVPELRRRLEQRGTDSPEVIERRFRDALSDISHWDEFDYAVVNDDLERAAEQLAAIVRGEPERVANSTDDPALQSRIRAIVGAAGD